MAFSQATISDVSLAADGRELRVAWTCSDPDPQTIQVYLNNVLTWWGTARSAHLPWPRLANTAVSVATVGPDEAETDFSSSLPALAPNTRTLSWEGGTFLADDIAGFRIYGSATAGGPVDYGAVLASLPAYPGGVVTDGFGQGGFGRGGFGHAASSYAWETASLASGSWTFAVAPFDTAGNQVGSPSTVTFTITSPPRPPAANAAGRRLSYAFHADAAGGFGTGGFGAGGFGVDTLTAVSYATLSWLASPA